MSSMKSYIMIVFVIILLFFVSTAYAFDLSFSVTELTASNHRFFDPFIFGDTILGPDGNLPPPINRYGGILGTGIEVNGFSYGRSDNFSESSVYFSVGPVSSGTQGSAVRNEPVDERNSDIFKAFLSGTNTQAYDGNGSTATPLSLVEPQSSDVDGLDLRIPEATAGTDKIYWTIDGQTAIAYPAYFNNGYSSADIFVGSAVAGYSDGELLNPPAIYAGAGELSLTATDDIDALVIQDDGDMDYNFNNDLVYFSLAADSPTLDVLGASAADILITGGGSNSIGIAANSLALGLLPTDELNALDFKAPATVIPEPLSSILFVTGGTLLAGGRYLKRKKRA